MCAACWNVAVHWASPDVWFIEADGAFVRLIRTPEAIPLLPIRLKQLRREERPGVGGDTFCGANRVLVDGRCHLQHTRGD